MTTISLRKLTITNFKGIKSLLIDFGKVTNIAGANASGKTTVVDAFRWLFFGKDSFDRTDFELQPLDSQGQMIPKVDAEVEAEIDIDGQKQVFKKVNHQKWPKKKGSKDAVYDGTENLYYWNGVPMRETDYRVKVSAIISEQLFKLVTDPRFFNTMKWQDRRKTLQEMAGEINVVALAAGNPKYLALLEELKHKTEEEYRKQIAATKSKIKADLEHIPARIDEVRKGMPEPADWVSLLTMLAEKEAAIAEVDASLVNESKAISQANEDIRSRQTQLHNLQSEANKIEYQIRQGIAGKRQEREGNIQEEKRKLRGYNDSYSRNTSDLLHTEKRIEALASEQAALRNQWTETNAREFKFDETELNNLRDEWIQVEGHEFPGIPDDQCACPTCLRLFDEADIEAKKQELEANFNAEKQRKLTQLTDRASAIKADKEKQEKAFTENKARQIQVIETRGTEIGNELTALEAKKASLTSDNKGLTESINTANKLIADLEAENNRLNGDEAKQLETDLAASGAYQNLLARIENLKAQDKPLEPSQAIDILKGKKQVMACEIEDIKQLLAKKQQIENAEARIASLEKEEERLANALAEQEGIEFTMLQFNKLKIAEVENRINGLFKFARFKMFEQQVNGGETPCCETTYLGVPYSDLNTASKMKVGIDIINALSKHYGVVAPIFLDNRESVTEIPETDAQIINLRVVPTGALRIENHAA